MLQALLISAAHTCRHRELAGVQIEQRAMERGSMAGHVRAFRRASGSTSKRSEHDPRQTRHVQKPPRVAYSLQTMYRPRYILGWPQYECTQRRLASSRGRVHGSLHLYTYASLTHSLDSIHVRHRQPSDRLQLRRNVLSMVVRCHAVSPSTLLLNLPRPFIMARAETCRLSYSTSWSLI